MPSQKQVPITDEILAQIERVTGTTLSADDIVVFEAAAASTRAISKMGSIYNGATMSRTMLTEMAQMVNTGAQSIPLHTLHQQGWELPVGKVFAAQVVDEPDGSSTLMTMFYMSKAEEDLIDKINLSVLDEVSVTVKSKHAYCSKCGFDYFGEDATYMNLWDQTCENGHVIGQDGAHLMLSGVDLFMELSLVSRGASNKPKIVARHREAYSDRMAADGIPVEATMLFTSMTMETKMPGDPKADPAPAQAQFDAQAAIEALTAQVAELAARIPAAAEPEPEPAPDANAELEALKAELAEKNAEIEALKAAAEAPAEPAAEPVTPAVPVGGVALSAVEDAKKPVVSDRSSAFKTKTR